MVNVGISETVRPDDGIIYNILIVDDERPVSRALKRTFKRSSLFKSEISLADNARAALCELERKKFDLVISDFKMPGMNGIDLLVNIKDKFPEVVRVLFTGFSDINVEKEAVNRAELHEYIEKPWDNDEISRLIHRALIQNIK